MQVGHFSLDLLIGVKNRVGTKSAATSYVWNSANNFTKNTA